MSELRFRQVHLDFHTSEHIPGVGSEFDPDQFVGTLREAAVNSVTLFSRCHHGFIYHDTKFPYRHPNLTTNLLAEQIRACHAADIRCPIYVTVGWDHLMARLHPDWIEINEAGTQCGRSPLGSGGWFNMCFASPYVDYVVAQTEEVCDLFGDEVDGFFFDIMHQSGVHGKYAMEAFASLGWDPASPADQQRMRVHLVDQCTRRLSAAVRAKRPLATQFFNAGHISPVMRTTLGSYSHLELESLPTGGWGYMHFPITVRYARTLGLDTLGMTGKFSATWGHFNSYKNPAALEFECFSALANGSKCSVGDQLPPGGRLDKASYDLIGAVYRQVRDREPWCAGAKAVTEIAVLNAEAYQTGASRLEGSNLGAARMLMEGRHQFDFVDFETDLAGYRVLVLPDQVPVDEAYADRIAAFIEGSGAVIFSHESGLLNETFNVPGAPVLFDGPLPFSPDFLRPVGTDTAFVMYDRGSQVRPTPGADVHAMIDRPYFNRTWDHFCSHAHTPPMGPTDDPGIVQLGRVIYFAHPIFHTYAEHSMSFHRDSFLSALDRLLPDRLVVASGPTSLQATMTRLPSGAEVLHLLHYIPERRGKRFDIVEDRLPLFDLAVSVRTMATTAFLQPQGEELEVRRNEDRAEVVVTKLDGHQMIVFGNP